MSSEVPHESPKATPNVFLTTRWTRVILAGDTDHPEAHAALSSLCQDYWRPLYYFARRKGHSEEEAQDLTQGFISMLLASNGIGKADRERGRFRSFLIGAFCHFLANQHRDQMVQKRGGGEIILSFDEDPEAGLADQAIDSMTPEALYERSWALALLDRVLARLRDEYSKAGRATLFTTLEPHLSGAGGRPGYARLGEQLAMSEGAVTVAIHRMRRSYGEILREEIGATVATVSEVEDELRYLIKVVADSTG